MEFIDKHLEENDFSPAIYNILRKFYPEFTMDMNSLVFLNKTIEICIFAFLDIYKSTKKVQNTVRLLLLNNPAVLNKINIYLNNFKLNQEKTRIIDHTRSECAELYLPVNLVEIYVRKFGYENYSNEFIIFVTAFVEYIIDEILKSTCEKINKRSYIKHRDIVKTVGKNCYLFPFFKKISGMSSNSDLWNKYIFSFVFLKDFMKNQHFCVVEPHKFSFLEFDPLTGVSSEQIKEFNVSQFCYSGYYSEIENHHIEMQKSEFLQQYVPVTDEKLNNLIKEHKLKFETFIETVDSKLDFSPCLLELCQKITQGSLDVDSFIFMNKIIIALFSCILQSYQIYKNLTESIHVIFGNNLFRHIISEVINSLNTFQMNISEESERSRSSLSDVNFQIYIVEEYLKLFEYTSYTNDFLIYIGTVMEYFCLEIIEMSWNIAMNNGKHVITKDFIIEGINSDQELLNVMLKIVPDLSEWSNYVDHYNISNGGMNISKTCSIGIISTEAKLGDKKTFEEIIRTKEIVYDETISDGSKYLRIEIQENIEQRETLLLSFIDNLRESLECDEDEDNEPKKSNESDNEVEEEEVFTFTKRELEEYKKKIIEDYLSSQGK